jgi:hypothetical protein
MPCYDSRDNERQVPVTDEDQRRLFKEWHHNSPVAELLCWTLTNMALGYRQGFLRGNPKLAHWWKDHQERDKSREQKAKEQKEKEQFVIRAQIKMLQAKLK